MNKKIHSVSAVITTYNRKDYLEKSLNSVINQHGNYIKEIIIVDDHSNYDIESYVDSLDNDIIKLIKLKENKGANYARNIGCRLAQGDFVAFLDDDDIWLSHKTKVQVEHMIRNNSDMSICGYSFLDNGEPIIHHQINKVELSHIKISNIFCGTSGFIIKKSRLKGLMFDTTLPCGQDWDYLIRAVQVHRVDYIPDSLYLYRRDSLNGITEKSKRLHADSFKI